MGKFASIDIGTNTILLLIAKIKDGKLKPIFEEERVVRLGEGLQNNSIISDEAMERGITTLKSYLQKCKENGVKKIFTIGTSVLREAKNSGDFLKSVKDSLGLTIQIISGEEEAYLSFLSVVRNIGEFEKPLMVIDIGGGSTEFILGHKEKVIKWISLPIGSVRLTEKFIHSDPIKIEEYKKMRHELKRLLKKIPQNPKPFLIVGVGGTVTTLASVELGLKRFNPKRVHHFILTKEALRRQIKLYSLLPLEDRKKIAGLYPSRADVILAGSIILYESMEKLKCTNLLISCHGIRYGVLYEKLLS